MSKIEVDAIDKQSGSTLTLGGSGTAVTLACGATQTGFGRTGTVDWQTTPKTSTFTAVSGEGYFVNTTGGAITVNLPAGSAGAIVSIMDYAATFQTNSATITPNGTDKIGGINGSVGLVVEGQSATFVYVDSTQGWLNTMDSTSNVRATAFPSATGGTIADCGNFRTHTFTGPGTFTVTSAGNPSGATTADYMVLAGGGSAGGFRGGGAGAGGFRESPGAASGCYSVSPLGAAPAAAITLAAQAYPITVGGGGAQSTNTKGNDGSNSVFSTITSAGGGAGGQGSPNTSPVSPGNNGGSGGGPGDSDGQGSYPTPGQGNTPPVSPPQGQNGGTPSTSGAGGFTGAGSGGGGAGAVGGNAGSSLAGGNGGAGVTTSISFSPVSYAGGGGGGTMNGPTPAGPRGGTAGSGGTGGGGAASATGNGSNGTTNRGGGGGGGGGAAPNSYTANGGAGGSGIVIIRYKFQ